MQNSGKNQWALSRALSRALYGHCTGTVRALSGVREKQHHYLFPPALRWEGSFVYLFALATVFKFPKQKMKTHPRKKNARVEPGSPDGLPLSKKIEEVGIITDSPTNISTWPSTYLCLGRPGTLKRAHIQIRVACFRRCATPVPPLLLLTPGFKGTYASPEPWHGWPHPV